MVNRRARGPRRSILDSVVWSLIIECILCVCVRIWVHECSPAKLTRNSFRWRDFTKKHPSNIDINISEPITFVTVPKPQIFESQIQMSLLTLKVWLSYPRANVIMACNESSYDPNNEILPEIRSLYGDDCISFIGDLPTGYENRPLIREWFKAGMAHVKSGFVCFLNGDIIIPRLWMETAYRIFEAMGSQSTTLIYGTRSDVYNRTDLWDLDLSGSDWIDTLATYLHNNKRCNNPYGMDVVLVHSSMTCLNWDELPDFVVGMCVWDNFFQGWANNQMQTVTMNFNPELYHVDHSPNACNSSNYNYFRKMSHMSPHFRSFHEHYMARWKLDYNKKKLHPRFGGSEKYLL